MRGSATSPLKFHCKQQVLEGVVGICVVASLKQVKQCSDANKVCRYAKKLLRVFNTTAVGGPKNSGKQILKKKKEKTTTKKVLIITVFLSGQCCVLPEVVDVGTMVTVMAMLMVLKTVTLCHT